MPGRASAASGRSGTRPISGSSTRCSARAIPIPRAGGDRGWIRRHAPWVRYVRLLAALGGNYAPAIAPWCDHAIAAPEHPDTQTGECGHDGVPGHAAREELVQPGDGATVVDYAPFRTALVRVLRSGVRPHLNLSSAPAVFTGGVVDFTHYHWNAAPVQDFAGWSAFVDGAFRSVADLHPERWRASITNEPNCLTLVGWEGDVRHVGFAGTPAEYARTFVTGARALRAAAPGIALHAGNYVTSTTFPGEDNLRTYLRFLGDAFAADGTVAGTDLTRDVAQPLRDARHERLRSRAGAGRTPRACGARGRSRAAADQGRRARDPSDHQPTLSTRRRISISIAPRTPRPGTRRRCASSSSRGA